MTSERLLRKRDRARAIEPDSTTPLAASPLKSDQQTVLRMQQTHGNRRTIQRLADIQREGMNDGLNDAELEMQLEEAREKEKIQAAYNAASQTPLRTLDDLLVLVKRVEAAYPGDDWKGITTRIRKSYYDGFLWDSMIKDREDYEGLKWPPLAVADYKAFTEARKKPEITINGQNVDIGHVFTGLDAMNFTRTGKVIGATGTQGPAGATWAGDVGSALAVWDVETDGDRKQRQTYYDKYASLDDMLGDVDGLAIKLNPAGGEAAMGGNKLSDRISWYYRGFAGSTGGASMRYTNFCAAAGFVWTGKGGGIKFDAATRSFVRDQINGFGKAYRLNSGGIPGANWFYDADLDWFTDHFLNWLAGQLAVEQP